MIPVVPPKSNRREPWEYDRELYKKRNQVERLFRRLKGFRRIFSLPAQCLEFVKARGALPDVSEQLGESNIGGTLGEFEKRLLSGAADALRIREVLVHHSIECVQKLFFGGLQFAFP